MVRPVTRRLLYAGVLASQLSWSAAPNDVGFELASSLPLEFIEYLNSTDGLDGYVLDSWLNPFYLQADFNGDGAKDIAVLLREKATKKRGILIVHGITSERFVIGAGFPIGNGGDSFSWMDAWYVRPKGPVVRGFSNDTDPPELLGDALYIQKLESSSALIYWTGTDYGWYQRSD